MKNKITAIAAIVALSVSSASFAHKHHHRYKEAMYKGEPAPVCQRTTLHDGLYLGISGAYDSFNARQDSNYLSAVGGNFIINNPMRVNGFNAGGFGGYGLTFANLFYIGAELFGNYSWANGTASFSVPGSFNSTTTVTARGGYGGSILPGIKPTDASLIYARLGYSRVNFRVNENFATTTNLGGGLTPAASNTTVWEGGFTYGMGVELALVDHLSMRTEFTHTDYSHFTNSVLSNVTGSGSKFSIADNQFMLGLVYHFDCTGFV